MLTAHTCTKSRCAGSSSHHFKDTMRAMGIHDTTRPNLRVQDISRRRLRGPESWSWASNVFIQYQCLLDVTTCVTSKSVCRPRRGLGYWYLPQLPSRTAELGGGRLIDYGGWSHFHAKAMCRREMCRREMSRRCGRKPIGSDVLKAANPGKAEGEECKHGPIRTGIWKEPITVDYRGGTSEGKAR